MKKNLCLIASLLALQFTPAFGQVAAGNYATGTLVLNNSSQTSQPSALTKFNLDFPGGTPAELVKAIEKALGKPLNVIIPDADASFQLPPLKLSDITFGQLSDTLREGSLKSESLPTYNQWGGPTGYLTIQTGYYFKTTDERPNDNSVWFFHVLKAPNQSAPKSCKFYSLATYLDRGFTVDDITTAIQTGWKMAGVSSTPELNYHKETKLLIVYGESDQLKTIDDVLKTLPSSNVSVASAATYAKTLDEAAKSLQDARNQINELNFRIKTLEAKMGKLTSATNSAPAEKSGR